MTDCVVVEGMASFAAVNAEAPAHAADAPQEKPRYKSYKWVNSSQTEVRYTKLVFQEEISQDQTRLQPQNAREQWSVR